MDKVLLIIGDAAEVTDTLYPYFHVQKDGYQVVLAAPESRSIILSCMISIPIGIKMLLSPIESVYATSQQAKRLLSRRNGVTEDLPVESDDLFAAALTFEVGHKVFEPCTLGALAPVMAAN